MFYANPSPQTLWELFGFWLMNDSTPFVRDSKFIANDWSDCSGYNTSGRNYIFQFLKYMEIYAYI